MGSALYLSFGPAAAERRLSNACSTSSDALPSCCFRHTGARGCFELGRRGSRGLPNIALREL